MKINVFSHLVELFTGGSSTSNYHFDDYFVILGTVVLTIMMIINIVSKTSLGHILIQYGERAYQFYATHTKSGAKLAFAEEQAAAAATAEDEDDVDGDLVTQAGIIRRALENPSDLRSTEALEALTCLRSRVISSETRRGVGAGNSILRAEGESEASYLLRVREMLATRSVHRAQAHAQAQAQAQAQGQGQGQGQGRAQEADLSDD